MIRTAISAVSLLVKFTDSHFFSYSLMTTREMRPSELIQASWWAILVGLSASCKSKKRATCCDEGGQQMFASRLSDDVEIVSTSGRQKYRGHSSCRGSPTAVRCLRAILSYPSNLISMAPLHAPPRNANCYHPTLLVLLVSFFSFFLSTTLSGLILLTTNFGPFGTRVIFGKAQAYSTVGPLPRS